LVDETEKFVRFISCREWNTMFCIYVSVRNSSFWGERNWKIIM